MAFIKTVDPQDAEGIVKQEYDKESAARGGYSIFSK